MDDLLNAFLTESRESLAVLEADLARLACHPEDPELLASILRLVHNIKGTCGFLDLARLEAVAHAAETMLGRLRDGEVAATPAGIGLLLQAVDRMGEMLDALAIGAPEPEGDDSALVAALAGPRPPLAAASGDQPEALCAAPAPVAPSLPRPAGRLEPPVQPEPTVRVPVRLLEQLETLLAGLAVTRDQLLPAASRMGGPALQRPLQRLDRVTGELQEAMERTRLQPIGTAWVRLPRLIRGLARALAKEIDLELRGGEIEVDRLLVEMIEGPLTHMVRNAADHGLEPPMERQHQGKPGRGRIGLTAAREGDRLVIEVSDDGQGLDTRRIAEQAVVRGLVAAADIAAMAEAEIQRLIFHPRLSTARTITPVSGRGVGMDVVRAAVEKSGGSIAIRSDAGRGSVFTIKIQLTARPRRP
jgi:two-component system, chemotaxis family, sensor kinase CheA